MSEGITNITHMFDGDNEASRKKGVIWKTMQRMVRFGLAHHSQEEHEDTMIRIFNVLRYSLMNTRVTKERNKEGQIEFRVLDVDELNPAQMEAYVQKQQNMEAAGIVRLTLIALPPDLFGLLRRCVCGFQPCNRNDRRRK